MIISNKEQVAKEVSQIMHGFSKCTVEGFLEEHSFNKKMLGNVLLAKLFG